MSILFLSINAFSLSQGSREFCEDRQDEDYVSEVLGAWSDNGRMSFRNRGGLFNGGVCWWHSRFQRNAAYLTYFSPRSPKPSEKEVDRIIRKIRKGRSVVEIPGFSNFNDFTRKYSDKIQKSLNRWQITDGFIGQQWVVGLAGRSKVSPAKMKRKMDKLYRYVSEGNVVYQKLQIPGIDAHAWLVIDMIKKGEGYHLYVIDSNFPEEVYIYKYRKGNTHFSYHNYTHFVPYTGKKLELKRLKRVAAKFCKKVRR